MKVDIKKAYLPILLLSLAACQQTPVKPKLAPFQRHMSNAEANIRAQNVTLAKAEFRNAAAADPSAAAPWRRLAELDFNARDYGFAIADTQELLKRDPADATGQSILALSTFKVAVDVIDLVQREADAKGPMHVEVGKVIAKMRATLGQESLNAPKKKRRATKPTAGPGVEFNRGAAVTRGLNDSSDPFSSLRSGD